MLKLFFIFRWRVTLPINQSIEYSRRRKNEPICKFTNKCSPPFPNNEISYVVDSFDSFDFFCDRFTNKEILYVERMNEKIESINNHQSNRRNQSIESKE